MAAGDFISNLLGTVRSYFLVGGTAGIRWKNDSSAFAARNSDDSAYVNVRVLAATADNDAVNYKQFLTKMGGCIVKRQADCSAARPNNTTVNGMVVVTTAGDTAVIGDLLYDNGLNDSAKMEIIAATEGQLIFVTDSLSGGTISFDADTVYMLDTDGGNVWRGQISESSGSIRCLEKTIDNSASQDSTAKLRASCRVLRCDVEITTPYSAGGTISVGYAGGLTAIQATTDNDPLTAGIYSKEQATTWTGSDAVVRVTVGGSPAAGAGKVRVWYSAPNA